MKRAVTKLVLSIVLFVLTALLLISCEGSSITIKFMVDGELYHTGTGTVAGIKMCDAPTKEGYEFDGWYYDEAGTEPFTLDSISKQALGKDIVVYAKWKAPQPRETYCLTINFGAGTRRDETTCTLYLSMAGFELGKDADFYYPDGDSIAFNLKPGRTFGTIKIANEVGDDYFDVDEYDAIAYFANKPIYHAVGFSDGTTLYNKDNFVMPSKDMNVTIEYEINPGVSGDCGPSVTYHIDEQGTLFLEGSGEVTSHPWISNNNIYYNEIKSISIGKDITKIDREFFNYSDQSTLVSIEDGNTAYMIAGDCLIETATKTLIWGCDKGVIPSDGSVTSIGKYAFYNCDELASITIPNTVTSIGKSAFYGCTGLSRITIPNTVTSVGEGAFYDCTGLSTATIPTIAIPALHKENLTTVIINGGTSIGEYAFYDEYEGEGCTKLKTITIPDTVKNIGDWAFADCTGLSTITIPNSVITIGDWAFVGCTGLSTITIPNSVTTIGEYAFRSCTGLSSIIIDKNSQLTTLYDENSQLPTIHYTAFEGCTKLTDATIPSTASGAMPKDSLTTVIINGGTSIGEYAFYGCSKLASITIPSTVTQIGRVAFCDCISLNKVIITDIAAWCNITFEDNPLEYAHKLYLNDELISELTIPNGVTSIKSYAFSGCAELTSVAIPNSVENIGYSAFKDCTELTEITIPSSVGAIEGYAFEGCTGLSEITIQSSVIRIGNNVGYFPDDVFEGCIGLTKATIPTTVISALPQRYLTTVIISGGASIPSGAFRDRIKLTTISIPNSVVSIGDFAFYGCTGLTEITIPSSVESIGDDAFKGCTGLTEITIPSSVESIGGGAFKGCTGLTEITIPNGVESIRGDTFSGCSQLASITIPGTVTQIGCDAFRDCNSLNKVSITDITAWCDITFDDNPLNYAHKLYFNDELISELTIPNGVTNIKKSAFSGCAGLTSIAIPNSVEIIGDYAFYLCTGLTEITIPSSVESIGDYAFRCCYKLVQITNLSEVNLSSPAYECGEVRNNTSTPFLNTLSTDSNGVQTYTTQTYTPWDITYLIGYCGKATSLDLSGYTNINCIYPFAFFRCTGLTEIKIPNDVESIENSSFSRCTGLTKIIIPNSLKRIEDEAFSRCTGLTEITIPSSVESIGSRAFYGCTGLSEITIPDSMTSVGYAAFSDTAWYNSQADGMVYVGKIAYKYKGTMPDNTSIDLLDGTKGIQNYAFDDCTGLTEITIPSSVESIGSRAFDGCTGLIEITIPSNVTSIGDYAFNGCTGLSEITLPDSVKSIGSRAFYGCTGLSEITIPNSVEGIGVGAFYYCSRLTSVTFADTDGWYYTAWENKTGGTAVDVTDAEVVADYLKNGYASYYWYKI